jgi:CRISPR type IV-associated protein Csf3
VKMEPFKVTFLLASPIVAPEWPIHLDALLAWAAVDRARSRGASLEASIAFQEVLPLERHEEGGEWVWKASVLRFTPKAPGTLLTWTRRTDIYGILEAKQSGVLDLGRKDKINLQTGHDRNYDERFMVQWMADATAWGVGDITETRELLSRLHGLGSIRRNGWGEIKSFSVERSDTCPWHMRALPRASVLRSDGHFESLGNLRPPYWRRENFLPVLECC